MRSIRTLALLGILFQPGNAVWSVRDAACQSTDSTRTLLEMYQDARLHTEAQDIFLRRGLRAAPLPLERIPWASASIREQMAAFHALRHPAPPPLVNSVRPISASEAGVFEETFGNTKWAYLGSNERIPVDTMLTRQLRAMLEAYFGPPTSTVAEQIGAGETASEYIQFEYRFVLNDTIPVMIVDVNGPFERGVVTMTDRKYRDLLPKLKHALLHPVLEEAVHAPYADYYYVSALESWFLTGFDGERFFLEGIPPPDLEQGRPSFDMQPDR